ncbi:MAG: RnfABCDGE type electron transport complex subunit B [Bacteroidales bacterium]|nr:RnfABCDGE type electron transport complex subunit B [Bacteroidales bacterium]
MTIVYTIACLVALGLFFAVVLYFVAQKFKVEEDPRIGQVESLLPGANCGGCGNAGCRAFAEKVVAADSLDDFFCPVGGNEVMARIAGALGREAVEKEPMVAVVRCQGTAEHCQKLNRYDGAPSCRVAATLYSGETGCRWGCIGLGDCVSACEFGGVHLDPRTHQVSIDTGLCTGCGGCARACPHHVIELRPRGPRGRRVYVSCVNQDKGALTRKACTIGCIGCGKCAKVCPFEAIRIENNLAYIDYTKCKGCGKCAAECPTHAIVATPIEK